MLSSIPVDKLTQVARKQRINTVSHIRQFKASLPRQSIKRHSVQNLSGLLFRKRRTFPDIPDIGSIHGTIELAAHAADKSVLPFWLKPDPIREVRLSLPEESKAVFSMHKETFGIDTTGGTVTTTD